MLFIADYWSDNQNHQKNQFRNYTSDATSLFSLYLVCLAYITFFFPPKKKLIRGNAPKWNFLISSEFVFLLTDWVGYSNLDDLWWTLILGTYSITFI